MKIDPDKRIFDVLYRKHAFLDYENIGLKKMQNLYVSKGLYHGFNKKKFRFCQLFLLGKIHQDKVFGNLLVSKQAFLDNRNIDLGKPQNCHFSQEVSP